MRSSLNLRPSPIYQQAHLYPPSTVNTFTVNNQVYKRSEDYARVQGSGRLAIYNLMRKDLSRVPTNLFEEIKSIKKTEKDLNLEDIIAFLDKYNITCKSADTGQRPLLVKFENNNSNKPYYIYCDSSDFYCVMLVESKYFSPVSDQKQTLNNLPKSIKQEITSYLNQKDYIMLTEATKGFFKLKVVAIFLSVRWLNSETDFEKLITFLEKHEYISINAVNFSGWSCNGSPMVKIITRFKLICDYIIKNKAINGLKLQDMGCLMDYVIINLMSSLTQFRELNFGHNQITDAGLKSLSGLLQLEKLNLNGNRITDAGLEYLSGLTQLKELTLCSNQITDAGLKYLSGLLQLEKLTLYCNRITDAGLKYLSGLLQLEKLTFYCSRITDAGLEYLGSLTQLKVLDLSGNQITDAGLGYLGCLLQLEKLNLNGNRITDAGLKYLRGLTQLKELDLNKNQITDAGYADIANWLYRTKIEYIKFPSYHIQSFIFQTSYKNRGLNIPITL